MTFGRNYLTIVIGKIFYEMAFTFQNMINAALKNNLELQHKENEYVLYYLGIWQTIQKMIKGQ